MTPKQTIESLYEAFGPSGAEEFFTRLNRSTESKSFVAHENIEVGNDVFTVGSWHATVRSNGKPLDVDLMFRWHVEGG